MEHSEKFELVKGYYDRGMWSKERVRNAVGKWINAEECEEIIAQRQAWREEINQLESGGGV